VQWFRISPFRGLFAKFEAPKIRARCQREFPATNRALFALPSPPFFLLNPRTPGGDRDSRAGPRTWAGLEAENPASCAGKQRSKPRPARFFFRATGYRQTTAGACFKKSLASNGPFALAPYGPGIHGNWNLPPPCAPIFFRTGRPPKQWGFSLSMDRM